MRDTPIPDSWYATAGDWLRAIEKTRDQHFPLEGLDGAPYDSAERCRDAFDAITRDYVRGLLDRGMSLARLAEVADFPCPACTSSAYVKGPHKFGCMLRGATQVALSLKDTCKKG